MHRHIVDQFPADIDPAAIADALQIFVAGQQHGWEFAGRSTKIKRPWVALGLPERLQLSLECEDDDRCRHKRPG
jgi:hypothetical protein